MVADLGLRDGLTGGQQVDALERIEYQIRARHATVKRLSLQPRRPHPPLMSAEKTLRKMHL